MTAPDPDGRGVADATWQALAQTRGGRPDWIKAHGTASRTNDPAECRGLAAVFGRALPEIPLTALKPYIGHCLGASGAVEAVAVALSLGSNLLPPILGTQRPDPQLPPCTIILEPHESSAKEALLLSESFGGRCAALRMGVP
jgi:3-oxoacyl-[acyl-carrier-protein] synthase II